MELRINGHTFNLFNEVRISLKYDSVADVFSFKLFFDPNNPVHRNVFRCGAFHRCTITHGGVLIMTGTMLSPSFESAGDPPKTLVNVSGYSVTGVYEDSCVLNCAPGAVKFFPNNTAITIPPNALQFNGLNLEQIASIVTGYYNLGMEVDPELQKDKQFTAPNTQTAVEPDETVKKYLDRMCKQKNVVLSHTAGGKLLMTRAKTDKIRTTHTTYVNVDQVPKTTDIDGAPSFNARAATTTTTKDRPILHHFAERGQWLTMNLGYNGQKMMRAIQVVGQGGSGNASDSGISNPLVDVGVERFRRTVQTSSRDNDSPLTARMALNADIKEAVSLTIKIHGWTLGGNLVVPNQLVTVVNPEVSLYKQSKWFVREVELFSDEVAQTATLTCVLPCAFNDEPIISPFG